MFMTLRNQILMGLGLLALAALLASHLAMPIDLTTVDIGRYIKNGQMVLQGQTQVLYKNFYSFTYPDYPFINHHWFFGIIAYVLFGLAGFKGLSLFFIILLLAAFGLAFDAARRYAGFAAAFFFSALALPLLASRPEIRPEGISVFFVALYFWLLQAFLQGRLGAKVLWTVVPICQVVWVNTHIFFFLGPVLVGIFLWQAHLSRNAGQEAVLRRLLLVAALVNLVNPSGLAGMLTPLNGFKKFGYPLAENQTDFFMIFRFPKNVLYKYFPMMAAVLATGMVAALRRQKIKAVPMALLAVFAAAAGFRAVRLFMPFAFLFVPLSAYFYGLFVKKKSTGALLIVAGTGCMAWYFLAMPVTPSIGLMPGVNGSARFFRNSGLQGPVFSNYDIGGYLIYHLEPAEKVFVDNRQEAFPPDFFDQVYIPMQQDESVWQKEQAEYGFNAIYFDRHDLTSWGQEFMVKRISDPAWAPVFVDNYTIIFARRGSANQPVIDRFELPKSMFRVTSYGVYQPKGSGHGGLL